MSEQEENERNMQRFWGWRYRWQSGRGDASAQSSDTTKAVTFKFEKCLQRCV
jgi:hypothetical protein